MARQLARLHRGNTWSAEVEMSLHIIETETGRTEWHGTFRATAGSVIEQGSYSLRLPDGREGDIVVTFASTFCDRSVIAQFIGVERRNRPS